MRNKTVILVSVMVLSVLIFMIKFYYNYSHTNSNLQQSVQPSGIMPSASGTTGQFNTNIPAEVKETKKEDIKPIVESPPIVDKNLSADKSAKSVQNNSIKRTGSFFVECLPWAYVYIDSMKVDITPLKSNILLDEGEHQVRLYNPNYPMYSRKIVISGSTLTNMKINLDTLFGYLDCKVFPWCEIYVDGKLKGQTPLQAPVRLNPGEHQIMLKNPEFSPVEYKIKINQNQTYSMKYNFKNVN